MKPDFRYRMIDPLTRFLTTIHPYLFHHFACSLDASLIMRDHQQKKTHETKEHVCIPLLLSKASIMLLFEFDGLVFPYTIQRGTEIAGPSISNLLMGESR